MNKLMRGERCQEKPFIQAVMVGAGLGVGRFTPGTVTLREPSATTPRLRMEKLRLGEVGRFVPGNSLGFLLGRQIPKPVLNCYLTF